MRDRIVAGINEPNLQKKLLQETSLTYQDAKKKLKTWEDVNRATSSQPTEVLFNRSKQPNRRQHPKFNKPPKRPFPNHQPADKNFSGRSPGLSTSARSCDSCGGLHKRSSCKFRQAICRLCQRTGHIARVCRSSQSSKSAYIEVDTDPDYIRVLTTATRFQSHLFQAVVFETGRTANLIVDTGSPVSFLPIDQLTKLGYKKQQLQPTNICIKGVSGHEHPVLGQINAMVHKQDSCPVNVNFVITKMGPMVLGLHGLRALQV